MKRKRNEAEMKVGIVIISYNNENHIVEAIESIKNQTLKDWVCVMVDNGSTDPTFEIIQKAIEGDQRFLARKKSNEGPAAGRNVGYAMLPKDIEYVHFLDGDDVLKPTYLETLVSYLEEHPEVGLAACQFDEIDFDSNDCGKGHRSRFAPNKMGWPHDLPLAEYNTPFVSFFASTAVGPFGVYRKSVFEKTNGYELKSQEDTDMFCKMSLLAEVHYLPEYLYKKRRHANNLAHKKSYRKTHQVFRDKWDLYQSDDPKENEIIRNAIRYYYLRHKPLRDFKVSMRAFKKFLRSFNFNELKWSFQVFGDGLSEVFLRKTYNKVMARREEQSQVAKSA